MEEGRENRLYAPGPAEACPVLVVAGEASGDIYAAQVVRAVNEMVAGGAPPRFFGSGGDAMRAEGVELLMDIHALSAIGPIEALKLAGNYLRLFRLLLAELKRRKARVALLVDFPDFNLPLSGFLRRRGVYALQYISPTVWAWRPGRIRVIRRNASRLLCIFPFEEKLYRDRGVDVEYVGHPMLSTVSEIEPPEAFRARYALPDDRCLISVLPGSRRKEIQHILPAVLEAMAILKREFPRALFLVPTASERSRAAIEFMLQDYFCPGTGLSREDVRLLDGDATNCMANSRVGIVKSGTSTLQAAVAGTPFVMVYRTTRPTWTLGQVILRNKYFCIVNLIAGREVVPEILQGRLTPQNVANALAGLLRSETAYLAMKRELAQIRDTLGRRHAPRRVAQCLLEALGYTPCREEDTHA